MAQMTRKNERPTGMKESVEEIWLAGLGALALTEEEGSKFFRTLVKKGEVVEQRARTRMEQTISAAKDAPATAMAKLEKTVDNTMENVMHRFGVPTRREIGGLTRRIEALSHSIEKKPRATPRPRKVSAEQPAQLS